jgi:V8-like Glu-specific endopeptidase
MTNLNRLIVLVLIAVLAFLTDWICSGDSGGPGLIYNPNLKKYLTIGVVSGNRWSTDDKQLLDPENKLDCFGL